jgi:hypothetical protein
LAEPAQGGLSFTLAGKWNRHGSRFMEVEFNYVQHLIKGFIRQEGCVTAMRL